MRYIAIVLAGSLAGCASHNAPPSVSADSAAAATDDPSTGPSFVPESSDSVAVAPVDAPWPRAQTSSSNSGTRWTSGADLPSTRAMTPATGNAAALPVQSPPASSYEADNSRVNARDRSGTALTPMDQGSSESDRKLTHRIREALGADGSLSVTAKNVKIITLGGKVTLRGAVKNDDERIKVAAAARNVAGDAQVENFLEVSK